MAHRSFHSLRDTTSAQTNRPSDITGICCSIYKQVILYFSEEQVKISIFESKRPTSLKFSSQRGQQVCDVKSDFLLATTESQVKVIARWTSSSIHKNNYLSPNLFIFYFLFIYFTLMEKSTNVNFCLKWLTCFRPSVGHNVSSQHHHHPSVADQAITSFLQAHQSLARVAVSSAAISFLSFPNTRWM